MKLTKPQQQSLLRLYQRSDALRIEKSFLAFRRTVQPYIGGGCVIVPWCGMWIGIEPDGYTHS